MQKLFDLISDRRFPWWTPLWLFRKIFTTGRTNLSEAELLVALTFDTEEDYPSKKTEAVGPFLDNLSALLAREKISVTIFLQGELLGEYHSKIKKISRAGNEIGVHGLKHNNWGRRVWFWDAPEITAPQKKADISEVLKKFQVIGLPKPISFRAPNLNSDTQTENLLRAQGFRVDSSSPAFRIHAEFTMGGGFYKLPLSSLRRPEIHWKNFLPFWDFAPFNLANYLSRQSRAEIYLKSLFRGNEIQYLVFLAHPWEFCQNPKFDYCSAKNWFELEKMITLLTRKYRARFVTISSLTSVLAKKIISQ